jgi:transcriptional regulator with XRE-family HTH domain
MKSRAPQPISEDHYALGRTARELRGRRAISQEQLGKDAKLHRNYVGAIERGEINPTFKILLRLCGGLEVSIVELFALYELRHAEVVTELRRLYKEAERVRRPSP